MEEANWVVIKTRMSWYKRFCRLQPKCSFFRTRKIPKSLSPILDILLFFSACWSVGQIPPITGQEVMVPCPQCLAEVQPTPAKLTGHLLQQSLPFLYSHCLSWLPEPATPVALPTTPNPEGPSPTYTWG